MSNEPAPPRTRFRLPSMARPAAPALTPTPTPEPPPPQPRPALARSAFRLNVLPQPAPTQPREPTPAPPPSAATVPSPVAAPPPETLSPAAGVASVPTSPAVRAASGVASLPTSPAPRAPAPSSSVPTSPAPKAAPSASVSTSPATKPVTTTYSVPNSPATKAVLTKHTVQTPPQSPKPESTAPPPSPLTLPPSQVKSDADLEPKIPLIPEQKTVLIQKTIDKTKEARDSLRGFADSLSSGIARLAKQETAKAVQTKEKVDRKKISSDSEDVGMRVITIAGENKGAFMEVIHSPKKHVFEGNSHFLHEKGNPRSEGSDWGSHNSSGEEGHSKKKDKNHKGRAIGPSPISAFMNSNVQGVNNSIVYDSSCSHHDPGVHVALSRKPSGSAGVHVKDRGNGYQS